MKYEKNKDNIIIYPENKIEAFNLGRISKSVDTVINYKEDNGLPEKHEVSISIKIQNIISKLWK